MAATVDNLFAFDATTALIDDHQYALLADAYLLDPDTRAFVQQHNPAALRDMTERMLEAQQRGMWQEPGAYKVDFIDVQHAAIRLGQHAGRKLRTAFA